MSSYKQIKPINILLVEDNPADIRLTQEVFKDGRIKNTLNIVMDGEEAMHYLRKKNKFADADTPDLILLDLNLPKKDGRTVLAEIKSDILLKFIPVIILTTSAAEQDILNTYSNHANCYIMKPVDLSQFITVVRSIEDFWLSIVRLPKIEE
ncbi:MAG TPA: response regulator [Bacteroidia bacterium]|jgi:chemotaxis family two-component system response regulator Rcp1|nr:response regulator [Bacteroidia bacterium]